MKSLRSFAIQLGTSGGLVGDEINTVTLTYPKANTRLAP
mgnify:CR=1 FL=1